MSKADSRRKTVRYAHLKMIQTGTDKKKRKLLPHEVKKVIVSDFYMAVRDSFENPDIKLVPMVSIVSRKKERHKEEDFRYFAL